MQKVSFEAHEIWLEVSRNGKFRSNSNLKLLLGPNFKNSSANAWSGHFCIIFFLWFSIAHFSTRKIVHHHDTNSNYFGMSPIIRTWLNFVFFFFLLFLFHFKQFSSFRRLDYGRWEANSVLGGIFCSGRKFMKKIWVNFGWETGFCTLFYEKSVSQPQ